MEIRLKNRKIDNFLNIYEHLEQMLFNQFI